MMETDDAIAYKCLRAPSEDGQVLCDPPLSESEHWLTENTGRRCSAQYDLHGCWLSDIQAEARRALLQRARKYTARYRQLPDWAPDADAPFILAGHQPALVHAGVWFKNFVLSNLAKRSSAHAINLLVDNDAVRSTLLRVPSGSVEKPFLSTAALARAADPTPLH